MGICKSPWAATDRSLKPPRICCYVACHLMIGMTSVSGNGAWIYKIVASNTHNTNNFVISIAILIETAYNKSVIIRVDNSNKSVKEYFCGTIDFE